MISWRIGLFIVLSMRGSDLVLSIKERSPPFSASIIKSFKKEEIKVPHQQVQKVKKSDRWQPWRKRAVIDEGHIYRYSIWKVADVYIYIYIVNTSFILCRERVDRCKK